MCDFEVQLWYQSANLVDYKTARQLLGADAVIGVTVCTIEEARKAGEDGADYIGIGTVFSTQT